MILRIIGGSPIDKGSESRQKAGFLITVYFNFYDAGAEEKRGREIPGELLIKEILSQGADRSRCIGFVFGYLLYYAVKHTDKFDITLLSTAIGAIGSQAVIA